MGAPSSDRGAAEPTGEVAADGESAVALIFAAYRGDLVALRRAIARGVDLGVADYDTRTPLHLAADVVFPERGHCPLPYSSLPTASATRRQRSMVAANCSKLSD